MTSVEVIIKSLAESRDNLLKFLDGLTPEEVAWRPGPECNSIAFILWHLSRVEDFWVNRVIQRHKELYEAGGWQQRLGTPVKAYGLTLEEVQDWRAPQTELLLQYFDSVRRGTVDFLRSIGAEKLSELARPERPPDTVGDILSHLVTEIAMHVGQIGYIRGVQRGLDK